MLHFLINPSTGNGAGPAVFSKLEQVLKEEKVFYDVHLLKSGADTTETVKRLSGSATGKNPVHIVVVGGDGTLNLVLQGIVDFENTYISCIKTGSGNDFARSMELDSDPVCALKHILHSPSHLVIDYGEAKFKPVDVKPDVIFEQDDRGYVSRKFLISCGLGYDADICEQANRSKLKKLLNRVHLGSIVYLFVGIQQIFTRKCCSVQITTDQFGGKISQLFMCATMIQRYEGGGVPFCPNADCRDGKLSICIVRGLSKLKLMMAVVAVYAKKHILFKGISEYKTQSITMKAKTPQWIHMDGEVWCKTKVICMTNKSGLNFIK